MTKKTRINLTLLCFLLSTFCLFSIGMAWKIYADREKGKHTFQELAKQVMITNDVILENSKSETNYPSEESIYEITAM